uniref:Domain of unknown function DB domain-containing protein n=1 Tax=Heliothis virescens TaxID=7102 RepID=A0A2A4J0V7_HELVI
MADGRNHVPCCVQERVPDICQDVCRGEFTPVTDNIKTHYSCASYMEKTLACIVEGIGELALRLKYDTLFLKTYLGGWLTLPVTKRLAIALVKD